MRKGAAVFFGLVLLLGLVAFFASRLSTRAPSGSTSVSVPELISPEAMHAAWKTRVNEILQTYDRDANAPSAEDALSALRVAAKDRDVHLQLVLAFASIIQGDKKGMERLRKARADFEAQP